MMTTSAPPPSDSPSPAPEPPPPVVQVAPAPPARAITFFVHVKQVRRNDLNDLLAPDGSVLHYLMRLGIGVGPRIYTSWRIDGDAGLLVLGGPEQSASVPLHRLSLEEMAALRFLIANLDAKTTRHTHGWRAHVIEQLAAMVPLFDFDGDQINPAVAVAHFRGLTVPN